VDTENVDTGAENFDLLDSPIRVEQPADNVEPELVEIPEYMMEMMEQVPVQANIDRNTTEKDEPWDLDSLVSIMTEGDVKLTAFIIKKIGELRTKTWNQRKVIAARLKAKKVKKATHAAMKKKATAGRIKATAEYKQLIKSSRYETAQINRDVQSYDRIMAKLTSMADWPKCKSGWRQFGRSCYKILKRNYAYLQEYRCLQAGGSLVRVDSADDKKAIAFMSKYESYLQVGFWRSMRTGNWEYLDGTSVNPNSWYRWINGNYNNRNYNYAAYYRGNGRLYPMTYSWRWGALCEHRLQVNLRK
jgi:hypothetical protein